MPNTNKIRLAIYAFCSLVVLSSTAQSILPPLIEWHGKSESLIAKHQKIFSLINMDDVVYSRRNAYIDSLRNTNMPVQHDATDLINAFVNAVLDTKLTRHSQEVKYYPRAVKLAIEIMELLKKEYHLK